jgi:hypothetical protein
VAGAGARVAMRVVADGVADGVGVTPEFTVAGSVAIALFGAIVGAGGGLLYEAMADRLPGPARAHGLAFGLLLLLVIGPIFFLGNQEFFSVGRVVLFAILFFVFGIAIGFVRSPSRRLALALPLIPQVSLVLVGLLGLSFLAVGIAGLALQSSGISPM